MDFLKPAFSVLKNFRRHPGKNLKLLLSGELNKISDHRKHQAVSRIVYEVTRNHRLLAHLVEQRSNRKLSKIDPDILLLLEIGAYLLLFSGSSPDYAVVNEAVARTKRNAKSFVNALLRNIAANKTHIIRDLEKIRDLGILYSISPLLIENLKPISTHLEDDLKYLNREPRFHIRVNPGEAGFAETRQFLVDNEIAFKELPKFHSFEIKESHLVIRRLKEKRQFYFQDTASQLISIIASRYARQSVLDCCAAPGTKSVTLALLNPQLTIYANDIDPNRVSLIKEFLAHYPFTRIIPLVSDIRRGLAAPTQEGPSRCRAADGPSCGALIGAPGLPVIPSVCQKNSGSFPMLQPHINRKGLAAPAQEGPGLLPPNNKEIDFIILDAPCTSSGTLRKNPDLKIKIDPHLVDKNALRQREIIEAVITNFSKTPYILYSVCSFTRAETEEIMRHVFTHLPAAAGYEPIDLRPLLEEFGFNYNAGKYGYYLLPNDELNNEIFYIALLRRRSF